MKTYLTFAALFFVGLAGLNAQSVEMIRVKGNNAPEFFDKYQYKFPSFARGKVYLKDGEVASARLNFDYFSNAVKYIDEKGDTVLIGNSSDVNYISTSLDTFFYDDQYYEWVATSPRARLAARHTLKLVQTEKVGANGISSPTHNIVAQGLLRCHQLQAGSKRRVRIFKRNYLLHQRSRGALCRGQQEKHQEDVS